MEEDWLGESRREASTNQAVDGKERMGERQREKRKIRGEGSQKEKWEVPEESIVMWWFCLEPILAAPLLPFL